MATNPHRASLLAWFNANLPPLDPFLGMAIRPLGSHPQWLSLRSCLGSTPLLLPGHSYPGLLYNPMIAGEAAAIVILGLVVYSEWWYILSVAPLLIFSQSRLELWLTLATLWP